MLKMRTGPVLVHHYGTYQNDEGQPMVRKDGSPVEFVEVVADGEPEARRFTLDQSVNGSRVPENTVAELVLITEARQEARLGRSGRPYIHTAIKSRVLEFAGAKN